MRKILFLSPHWYTSTMSFAMESVISLAERGHIVDLIVSSKASPPVIFSHSNIRVILFKDTNKLTRYLYLNFLKKVFRQVFNYKYDVVICLSEYSLIIGYLISLVFDIPYVYYNDELHFGNESKRLLGKIYGFFIKKLERIANRCVLFTVTQDKMRGQTLAKLNHIPLKSLRYLPNSRSGQAQIRKSFYLHDRLGFLHDTKIILWLGGVSPGDGAIELARSTEKWPSDYRMVFHFPKNPLSDYAKSIVQYHGFGKTYVSVKPVPYKYVNKFIMSATIALGIYADEGPNTRFIGASSGKINLFLQNGIPCIVNNFEGLLWVEAGGAGICIDSTMDVLPATQKILSSYEEYQQQSVDAFNRLLNYDEAFEPIAEELEEILAIKQKN